jgi:RecB family endonuclease NucS
MRLVVASCSVIYTGRGDTNLPRAIRAIMLKGDGAVSIHSDFGNKPLNYMGKGNTHTITTQVDGTIEWAFDTRKESIRILLHDVISDSDHVLEVEEPGLTRDGTEPQLQAWLADHPETLGLGWTTIQREYQTGAGPVDLLVHDADGKPVAVEIKRTGTAAAIYQVNRYVAAMNETREPEAPEVRGVVVAVEFRPRAVVVANKFNIPLITVAKSDFIKGTGETASSENAET